ncbi:hypothetical protein DPMN_106077 [Dreissena polymorpha]|uniref:Uncharacterized protein n=1 Tax=Dreissena polymorpha TaxID=45954 RepID=A0A9D4K4H6_DREPO|nr:hypothetical protein DPMN_106077 [Dreissena polymorpha]
MNNYNISTRYNNATSLLMWGRQWWETWTWLSCHNRINIATGVQNSSKAARQYAGNMAYR